MVCDTKSTRYATKNPSWSSVKLTYLGVQMDLSEQQNIGIIVNQSFSKIQNNLASSEQSSMPIMDDSFFYKKKE